MKKPISRREFIQSTSSALAALNVGRAQSLTSRPNIVFVFADQMRASALGCMGNSFVRTPNLDKLAGQGMLFQNGISSAPVCSPYRAQLMTGMYSHRNSVVHNDLKLPESHITLAEILRDRGYLTGYIGKWHLDAGRMASDGDVRKQGYVPVGAARQGWDYWAALECSHNYFHTHYYTDSTDPIAIDGYEPDVQTDLAIEFVKHARQRPFCLMLSWGPPHNPYTPPKEFAVYDPAKVPVPPNVPKQFEEVARKKLADYYGLVTSLDANMARIVRALDEAGLADNTILCFTSDHGDMLHSQGKTMKQKPWEESMHVPWIMRYPKGIRAGQKTELLFNSVDIMPTLLGLCGVKPPASVQGKDLSKVILGKSKTEPDSAYLAITSFGPEGPGQDWRGVRTKEWLYAATPKGDWLLYNIQRDPYEMTNLVDDPAHRKVLLKLRERTRQWIKETGDPFQLPT